MVSVKVVIRVRVGFRARVMVVHKPKSRFTSRALSSGRSSVGSLSKADPALKSGETRPVFLLVFSCRNCCSKNWHECATSGEGGEPES